MDYTLIIMLEMFRAIAWLVLLASGLAIIFGMMRVINFAHGEFLMLGGYITIMTHNAGVPLWISMLILAPLTVGIFGVLVERLIIRHLYGRIIDSLLATWGLSLLMIGGCLAASLQAAPVLQRSLSRWTAGAMSWKVPSLFW